MTSILHSIGDFFYYVWNQITSIGFTEVLDILILFDLLRLHLCSPKKSRKAGFGYFCIADGNVDQ